MKTLTYQEFLDELNVVSESEYNKMLSELPDLNFNKNLRYDLSEYSISDFDNINEIAGYFVSENLPKYWQAYSVNIFNKTLRLNYYGDISSDKFMSQLEELKNVFRTKGFIIENYNILIDNFKKENDPKYKLRMYTANLTKDEKIDLLNLLKDELHDKQT